MKKSHVKFSTFCAAFLITILNLIPFDIVAFDFELNAKPMFIENKGQVWDTSKEPCEAVKFFYNTGNVQIFLMENGLAYQFKSVHRKESAQIDATSNLSTNDFTETVTTFRMDMKLEGANINAEISKSDESSEYINYYNRGGITNVKKYGKIIYHDIYPGIDWVIYTNGKELKYDFIVHPGADPGLISMKFSHHDWIRLDEDGGFTVGNTMGSFTEKSPVSYQDQKVVPTKFKLEKDAISFDLNSYDKNMALTIDPNILWATYFGGSLGEIVRAVKTDHLGFVYMAGSASSTSDISTPGAFQEEHAGGTSDIFLAKFNPDGNLLWSTYYGGEAEELILNYSIDNLSNIYLAGDTKSLDGIATEGAHQPSKFSTDPFVADVFIAKFNDSGNLIWGTYYGGNGFDRALACHANQQGEVYIAGHSSSSVNIASPGAHKEVYDTNADIYGDGFLAKFDSSGVRQWGTYIGGDNTDQVWSCKSDNSGNVFIAGHTSSSNNIATEDAHQIINQGLKDVFLMKFSPLGQKLWGTYYGGEDDEQATTLDLDSNSNVYITGRTESDGFIATTGVHQENRNNAIDAFLVKFNADGSRVWGTYFGGPSNDVGWGCALHPNGNILVTGYTLSTDGIATLDAWQDSIAGDFQPGIGVDQDSFVAIFNQEGQLNWASYFGGAQKEFETSCAIDPFGNMYVAITTKSDDLITSVGAHQPEMTGGFNEVFLMKFEDCPVNSSINNQPDDETAEIGATVSFSITSTYGNNAFYQWQLNGVEGFSNLEETIQFTGTNTNTLQIQNISESNHEQQFRCLVQFDLCTDVSDSAMLTVLSLGLNQTNTKNPVSIFPNPNQGQFKVDIPYSMIGSSFQIKDMIGRTKKSGVLNDQNQNIDIADFASGVYLINVQNIDKQSYSLKLIKR